MTTSEEALKPSKIMSVSDLAAALGVTERRVRQMRESGELIGCGRDAIDAAHAINSVSGRRFLGKGKATQNVYTNAAVGWLLGYRDRGVGPRALDAWYSLSAGWGLSKARATLALFDAAALLGSDCPHFRHHYDPVKDTDG